jgi:hypothetical protein
MFFARTTTIVLLDANDFDAYYAAWMMRYARHVAYGNNACDEANKTTYSDFREDWCIKRST